MSTAYQIVVCGSIVPDPLQTLEPVASPTGPALKNELLRLGQRGAVFTFGFHIRQMPESALSFEHEN